MATDSPTWISTMSPPGTSDCQLPPLAHGLSLVQIRGQVA